MAKKPTIVDQLFDYAFDSPEGFTIPDFAEHANVEVATARAAVTRLRRALGSGEINLVCNSAGHNAPWVYRLVATYEDAKWWASNRLDDTETRLVTINAVASSLCHATDGRSVEGRRARLMRKAVSRLIEDLQEMHTEAGLT